ncbi:MAG: hypothetical protein AAFR42_05765 [Cyanobacteria bacterium J06628_6]
MTYRMMYPVFNPVRQGRYALTGGMAFASISLTISTPPPIP